MKFQHILCSLGLLFGSCSMARAELVTFTLTLDAPSSTANRLSLSLLGGAATSDLAGSFNAQVEFNRATGVVSTVELLYTGVPSITSTDWVMATAIGPVSTTGIVAAMDTNVPASAVTGVNFLASEQELRLIGGSISAPAISFTDTFGPADAASVDIPGIVAPGTGSITSTFNAGAGSYDLVFTLPINNSQELQPGASIQIVGNILARGQISAVPEPSSVLLLLASASTIVFGRRRLI